MSAAQAVINRHVDAMKASRDGAGIPREAHLQSVMAGSNGCYCMAAQHLLAKERK
jgi:hypothetical protein